MSRIGRKPIPIPAGVEVSVNGTEVTVKGPKGQLARHVHPEMKVIVQDNQVIVERPSDEKLHRALHGTTRSVIANMVEGVTNGYTKSLELVGVGYRAAKQGNKVTLSVGFSHPVDLPQVEGIEVEVPAQNKIVVRGIDKELVGIYAAKVRSIRPPEPYKGKGIRYEGENVRRKVGKTGKK
ncbi:50S ribosomal protein L6 [Alicyclobacillus acidocaldarius]|uniref:Large ribosomal subunit protein uL6 n=1 Tax=Alicyclobacillus acidocaldarius subsp. acidocaldarius (strain ATCC 27009 / DSM 446 / BCRC 14685 / JCM 5260 / KCTC 1825 / NBRC 15652 / NCIMB 11725 / NRRL B-14509 / 104-IA) TaxID=521098 RepID=C8WTV8_ALIAD|nr:50S ribosomal protein L6 [Alicyclobacillus acidocaldarius]ACV59700.1 ribosomal protein L6 [Alicyclobacillus acidocaldarius subsp. acidocaldarius DSM 446]